MVTPDQTNNHQLILEVKKMRSRRIRIIIIFIVELCFELWFLSGITFRFAPFNLRDELVGFAVEILGSELNMANIQKLKTGMTEGQSFDSLFQSFDLSHFVFHRYHLSNTQMRLFGITWANHSIRQLGLIGLPWAYSKMAKVRRKT